MSHHAQQKIEKIKKHFQEKDKMLFSVITKMEFELLEKETDTDRYFSKLCRDIIAQQLGSGAAHAILERFLHLFPKKHPTTKSVLKLSEQALRDVGMSWAKARSIRDLALKTHAGEVSFDRFHSLSNGEVIAELIKVRGIGKWTAQMFLMFTLGREDVFSEGDLGLRKGIERIYGKRRVATPKSILRITEAWTPYRSYGSLALWYVNDSK